MKHGKLCIVVPLCNLVLERLRQEDCCELSASLGYIATRVAPVKKEKVKKEFIVSPFYKTRNLCGFPKLLSEKLILGPSSLLAPLCKVAQSLFPGIWEHSKSTPLHFFRKTG